MRGEPTIRPDATPEAKHIAKLIYRHRDEATSQTKLAALVGASQQNVSSWETGRSAPSIANLALCIKYLGPDPVVLHRMFIAIADDLEAARENEVAA